ncbi:MAG: aminoacyl-tRNA deacylase [Desulfarculaceae bacterium]|nr:aminoacyl-tRNA deacylase [Desulfarculaceae bacterium]MCF8049057.1 aminoacyl-tRNA deacylase [Desulfarculaceae bacterium]MCF8063948.1 aminoacyl-tRNA deacylase [Desulfarculaceae bacterium]MCF8123007.1 aminoacyl-tRNA deacylase [Desulfarculaceae bacterium]
MAKKDKIPATPALHALKGAGVAFIPRPYGYVAHGGTGEAAGQLGVDEHQVVKTLVMQDESGDPLVVLMHGDKEVSTKNLARQLGRKSVEPCAERDAQRYTGYQVGGISPFGIRREMPVFVEKGILDLERVYINGGKRGLLVEITPAVLLKLLNPTPVEAAL